ncbi:DUF4292 domain-containing protein [Flavobacterium sp.]|uniref:DUF4292 domain-containing protein n=1 Tax=Flavobacterium sp. TaxID=239 RepID=UPI002FDB7CE3
MKKLFLLIVGLVLLQSCRTQKGIAEGKATEQVAVQKIIDQHYALKTNFETVYIRANTKYKDNNQSLGFTTEIKIKRNEIILVSVRFLGMTMAKGLLTPDSVQYYEKNGGTYFEGNYGTLSNWLGTDLDFFKVQNMLIGQAMDNLRDKKYISSIENNQFKLSETGTTAKSFYFEAENFLIKRQEIEQFDKNRKLKVTYPNYKSYKESVLPLTVLIEAMQEDQRNTITLDYNTVTFNEALSFPYKVPEGFTLKTIEN